MDIDQKLDISSDNELESNHEFLSDDSASEFEEENYEEPKKSVSEPEIAKPKDEKTIVEKIAETSFEMNVEVEEMNNETFSEFHQTKENVESQRNLGIQEFEKINLVTNKELIDLLDKQYIEENVESKNGLGYINDISSTAFKKLYIDLVTESFGDDLNELRQSESLDKNKLEVLIDSLQSGASVFSDKERKTVLSVKTGE
ncbi:hypothetical protein BB559_000563 [Furculomyces boomerangus]|uniref:Ribosome assembly protein 3 n=2 Tax=Harpellales TaxID=61421 RepID=A0A2T9Z4T3_9FUNG|nr:hypothetical protein BB559_000563 [Furculomyces boomerangus]PWA00938.1 hypothetical protein BB558_002981 [Smittium angustum]